MTEFQLIVRQVKLRKAEFTAKLIRHLRAVPNDRHDTPCMVWTKGYLQPNGYARTKMWDPEKKDYAYVYVHRLFLILKLCRPIAEGMEAGHLCGNGLCVSHVEEQTRNDNMKDCNGRRWGKKARNA